MCVYVRRGNLLTGRKMASGSGAESGFSSASWGGVDMGHERVGRIVMACIQGPVAVFALVQYARLVRFAGCCTRSMRLKKIFHVVLALVCICLFPPHSGPPPSFPCKAGRSKQRVAIHNS